MRQFLAGLILFALAPPLLAQPSAPATELDRFMEKVLARREQNRITLRQYVLDEIEAIEVLGPGRAPLYRRQKEFTWYVRDGLHVRSPVRIGGVEVGEGERAAYEQEWARRERDRLERRRKKAAAEDDKPEPIDDPGIGPADATPIPTPRFVSEAYFMEFKFEPGNYYLAGREQLEGQEVLRIEYYPERMFGDDKDRDRQAAADEPHAGRRRDRRERDKDFERRIERQMNKTALVTLWVDPAAHQIVKYTFENVWMDFLPGAWLVRVDEIRASMTMGQPFPDVWLPREMSVSGGVTLANGSFDANYERRFSNYKLADVTTRIRIPKLPPPPPSPSPEVEPLQPPAVEGSGPFADAPWQPAEVVAEIRVHGNAYIPDADVIGLARVTVGQPFSEGLLAEIERRLVETGRFESVEVRKRYRSLSTSATEVTLLLIVHERPGVTTAAEDIGPIGGPWRRFRSRLMFLPILTYDDGYGFTYGARFSTVSLLGLGERLSTPLTWGGTRRAAIEVERTFERGPLTLISSSFGIWQRENPHFELDDRRVEWRGRAERRFADLFLAGAEASTSSIDFGSVDDRLWTFGADVAFDTRADPSFPRNAVRLAAGWIALHPREGNGRVNRYSTDARGYLGLIGQAVLAGRVQYTAADRALPTYERLLLGGSSTLRGFRTGTFSGDRTIVTSAELRVPLTSVLHAARLGVTGFFDAAKAYDTGMRSGDVEWRRAAGAGVFLIASIVRLNIDVAHGFDSGDNRVHVGMGFAF